MYTKTYIDFGNAEVGSGSMLTTVRVGDTVLCGDRVYLVQERGQTLGGKNVQFVRLKEVVGPDLEALGSYDWIEKARAIDKARAKDGDDD